METRPLPWWARARTRGLLLALLLAGALTLLVLRSQSGSAGGGCWLDEGPTEIQLTRGAVASALPRLGLIELAHGGRVSVAGLTSTSAVFSEDPPRPVDLHRDPGRLVPAGYGLRWTDRDGQQYGAAAFRLADPTQAVAFSEVAGSARCRPGVQEERTARPAGARAVIRDSAAGEREADVLFARGSTAYWLLALARHGRGSTALAAAVELACRLPAAGCYAAAPQPLTR